MAMEGSEEMQEFEIEVSHRPRSSGTPHNPKRNEKQSNFLRTGANGKLLEGRCLGRIPRPRTVAGILCDQFNLGSIEALFSYPENLHSVGIFVYASLFSNTSS